VGQTLNVVITGASAGLGRAIAQEFGKTGARVGLISRDLPALDETAAEVKHLGGTAATYAADVSDDKAAAPAKYPATDYGWIETSAAAPGRFPSSLLNVKKFQEKPSFDVARNLMDRGCVWNTFVMIGTASAFEDAIRAAVPEIWKAFDPLRNMSSAAEESRAAQEIYGTLPAADFSKLVLSNVPERLGVFCLRDIGWSDLGTPERLIEVLAKTDGRSEWLDAWREEEQRIAHGKGPATECCPSELTASA
jgi:NAD(P)-dependent dehydrogenase (short-subunit alcohol dehydrogenase family)